MRPRAVLDATTLFVTSDEHKKHVGTNPKIMLKATSDAGFEQWLANAKQKVLTGLKNTTGDADFWITCESGTRRSVAAAAAAVLKPILEEEGYEVREVVDLSKQVWKFTCGGECYECMKNDSTDQKLAEGAAKIFWQVNYMPQRRTE